LYTRVRWKSLQLRGADFSLTSIVNQKRIT
jgi:hypothetical protein